MDNTLVFSLLCCVASHTSVHLLDNTCSQPEPHLPKCKGLLSANLKIVQTSALKMKVGKVGTGNKQEEKSSLETDSRTESERFQKPYQERC